MSISLVSQSETLFLGVAVEILSHSSYLQPKHAAFDNKLKQSKFYGTKVGYSFSAKLQRFGNVCFVSLFRECGHRNQALDLFRRQISHL